MQADTSRTAARLFIVAALFISQAGAVLAAGDTPKVDAPAPQVLIDNNKVLVSLVTLKRGDERLQKTTHQADELIVYLDDGAYERLAKDATGLGNSAAPPAAACTAGTADCGPIRPDGTPAKNEGEITRGSVEWHPKGSESEPLRVTKGFREVIIEMKHGTMTGPDPAAAKLPREPVVGGGAPMRALIDNAMVRTNLVSFPSDFIRAGGYRRRLDTVMVYVDDAELKDVGPSQKDYAVVQSFEHHPDAQADCPPIKDCDSVAPDGKWANGPIRSGTVAWHQQDGYVERVQIGKAYRVFYIELKQ